VRELGEKREERRRVKGESEVARRYFGNLVREVESGRGRVEDVDLEGGARGFVFGGGGAGGGGGGFEEGVMV